MSWLKQEPTYKQQKWIKSVHFGGNHLLTLFFRGLRKLTYGKHLKENLSSCVINVSDYYYCYKKCHYFNRLLENGYHVSWKWVKVAMVKQGADWYAKAWSQTTVTPTPTHFSFRGYSCYLCRKKNIIYFSEG